MEKHLFAYTGGKCHQQRISVILWKLLKLKPLAKINAIFSGHARGARDECNIDGFDTRAKGKKERTFDLGVAKKKRRARAPFIIY